MIEYYKLRERQEKHFDDTTEIVGLDGKVFSVSPYPYSDGNRKQMCETANRAFTAGFNFALATTKQMETDIRNRALEKAAENLEYMFVLIVGGALKAASEGSLVTVGELTDELLGALRSQKTNPLDTDPDK